MKSPTTSTTLASGSFSIAAGSGLVATVVVCFFLRLAVRGFLISGSRCDFLALRRAEQEFQDGLALARCCAPAGMSGHHDTRRSGKASPRRTIRMVVVMLIAKGSPSRPLSCGISVTA
jgi:hypothetical protein